MLQSIRDKTSGWIAYLIVFLISIPFALWGVNSYLGGGAVPPAAIVDGSEISVQDLDTAYADYRRRLSQVFGGSIPEAFSDESLMKDQVLSQMVEEYALRAYSDKNKYRISDDQLNKIIRSMDVFQTDGKFDPDIYQRQLASQGYTTAGFEFELRRTQAMNQLQSGISATAFSIPASQNKLAALASQSRTIRTLTRILESEIYTVSDDEVKSHFETNQSRYMSEEEVKIDFIELSLAGIEATIEINEDEIQDQYEQSKQDYTSNESRTASHILLTLPADASKEDSEQTENRLKSLLAEINAGAEFADLARMHSQDPVSAEEGGSLGEVERGMMVQAFETALFELQVNEISQPIKSSFGWHLIKLHEISGGEIRSLDDVRLEITGELKTEKAESLIYDLTENLANLAYEQPDSLLPAAEQLGLNMQTSGWFSRSVGEGIASESKIRGTAFSDNVLNQGLNSEAIELVDNRIIFIHINDRKPAAPKLLEDVKDGILAELKRTKAREDNVEAGKKALEDLRSGQSLDTIANDWSIDIVESPSLNRTSSEIASDIVKLAFTMSKPDKDSVYEGFMHANGDYSLVELVSVETGDSSSFEEEPNKELNSAIASQEYQSVLKTVGSRADVVRTPANELDY